MQPGGIVHDLPKLVSVLKPNEGLQTQPISLYPSELRDTILSSSEKMGLFSNSTLFFGQTVALDKPESFHNNHAF